MKIKSLFLILTIRLFHLTSANAINNLVIKLDLTDQDQGLLNNMKTAAGVSPQAHKFHCTVGFIEGISSTEAGTIAKVAPATPDNELISFNQNLEKMKTDKNRHFFLKHGTVSHSDEGEKIIFLSH